MLPAGGAERNAGQRVLLLLLRRAVQATLQSGSPGQPSKPAAGSV
jgi:hypothetical protein